MILCFSVDASLRRYGFRPGAGSDWDTKRALQELAFCSKLGYEVVDTVAEGLADEGEFFLHTEQEWREARAVVEDAGLRFGTCNGRRRLICRYPWAEPAMAALERTAQVCEWLGVEIIDLMVGPTIAGQGGERPYPMIKSLWNASEQDFELTARWLKPYCKRLAGFGCALSLEMHEDTIHDTAQSALKLREMIGEPNVGLNPDTLDNAKLYPGEKLPDSIEQARMVAPHVNFWHIKQHGPGGTCYADEGVIPLMSHAQLFTQAGFGGPVYPEYVKRGADWIYALVRFRDYWRWVEQEYVPNMPLP